MSFQLLKSSRIRALRKKKMCSWCAEEIEVGSSAVRESVIFDGEFKVENFHEECFTAMEQAVDNLHDYDELEWTAGDYPRGGAENFEDQEWRRERGRVDCELNPEISPRELRVFQP